MKKLCGRLMGGVALATAVAVGAAQAQPIQYRAADGINNTPVSAASPLPVTGSFSATTTGFAPASTGTPISVTTGGVTGTLPAGTVVIASNVGATNNAYCKLGASATTSDQLISPNSWFAFTVGASTQLTCITSTSTTTVNMVGGSGLPTGSGGGGGSGGGIVTYTTTDKGGTVTAGGTAQAAIASNASRKIWCIQNDPSATEILSVRLNGTASATAGTILQAGQQACSIPGSLDTSAVSVFAATTGHRWFGFEGQ